MNDPEAPLRISAMRRLSEWFACEQQVPVVRTTGLSGYLDIAARPRAEELAHFVLALELKAWPEVSDNMLGAWIKQAADYVGAKISGSGGAAVTASLLWMVDVKCHEREPDKSRMDGMLQLAQYFRVGLVNEDGRGRLQMLFWPSQRFFDERKGWLPNATTLLNAKRVDGGLRR